MMFGSEDRSPNISSINGQVYSGIFGARAFHDLKLILALAIAVPLS